MRPGVIELTVPRARDRTGIGLAHRNRLDAVDVTVVDAIPATTVERTLIDLAGVLPRDAVEEALDDAIRRGLVTPARLRWRLESLAQRGRPGIAVVRALLEERAGASGVTQSVFEARLLRALRAAGLPEPQIQHPIKHLGRLIAIVDFAYPDAHLAIVADGHRWHSGRASWERDRARRNELTLMGWRVIHVTWADLMRTPEDVVDRIRRALDTSPT